MASKIPYIALALGFGFLAVFILYPIIFLLYGSFWSANPGFAGHLTLANYIKAFYSNQTYITLRNTVEYALGSAVFAVTLGVILSYILTRTDTPGKGFFHYAQYFPLALPAYVANLAWINIFDSRSGILNIWLRNAFGVAPFNIYSLAGMVWATGIALAPLSYIVISPAMRAMNPALEESSKSSGASSIQTFLRIVFPLVLPATLSAFILDLALSVEAFETSVQIGELAGIKVFMSTIYYDVGASAHPAYNIAATYGAILLILTSTLFYLYYRSIRSTSKYQVLTGRGYSSKVISIGKWRYATFAAMVGYFFVTVIAPFSVVVLISLAPFWNPYSLFAHLSLKNYHYLFAKSTGVFAIFTRSIATSGISATVVALLALTITFMVYRTKLRGRYNLERLAMLPLAMPSLLIGYGLLWAFLTIKTDLYGTIGVLIIAFSISFLPQGIRVMSGSIVQIHSDLEEASRVAGAGIFATMRNVILPLVRNSVIGGWIFVFIVSFKAVGNVVLLANSQNQVFSTFVWSLYTSGSGSTAQGNLGAASVVLMIILWALIGGLLLVQRRLVAEQLVS